MRVLITSTPGWGHIHPVIPLALALRGREDDVLWATGAASVGRVRPAGIDAAAAGLSDQDRWPLLRERHPEFDGLSPEDRPSLLFPKMFGETCAPPMLTDLMPLAREWRPDLIVHDAAELGSSDCPCGAA